MQCTIYNSKTRCKSNAIFWLLHPDGSKNPGGYVCKEHGEEIIQEYAEKLKEFWMLEEIDENGHTPCLCKKGSSLATDPCDICNGLGYII